MTKNQFKADTRGAQVINRKALEAYPPEFQLIDLHRWDATSQTKAGASRPDGKRPLHANWTKHNHGSSSDVIARCLKSGRNVGVRLKTDQLVIDVDPRNGGEEGFRNLCEDFFLDPAKLPCVRTGSGGLHLYMGKPGGVRVLDTLHHKSDTDTRKRYAGVEFKSIGRQVVAAGSKHPNGTLYCWAEDHPPITTALPPIDDMLLAAITRPERAESHGGGQIDEEQSERILNEVPPEDFRDQDAWLHWMMAFHHATGGDGRQEFIDWSCSDPNYSDHADIIGRRWDSLHKERNDGYTYKHINFVLGSKGLHKFKIRPAAEEVQRDFDDIEQPEREIFGDEAEDTFKLDDNDDWLEGNASRLDELNEKYTAVFGAGRYRIMYREHSHGRDRWTACGKSDFLNRFENERLERETEGRGRNAASAIPLGQAWQQWPRRKTADGITFDTTQKPGAIVGGALNLYGGYGVEPKPGTCELFKAMIRNDIASGDPRIAEYFMWWIAWKIQNPSRLPETSLVMTGGKGTGKSTLGESCANIFGEHGMVTSSSEQVLGRFNGHLESMFFIYLDEAVWAGDMKQEAQLKKLITDASATYEHKGVPSYTGVNRNGVMVGTNNSWAIPASTDERRFCVTQTSSEHQCLTDNPATQRNRAYWDAIRNEMENGGLAAFLYESLHTDLGRWHPRADVPSTDALGSQIVQGFKGLNRWYLEQLEQGCIEPPTFTGNDDQGVTLEDTSDDWSLWDLKLKPAAVKKAYSEWQARHNPHEVMTGEAMLRELKQFGWEGGDGRKHKGNRYWHAPSLPEARKLFEQRTKSRGLFEDV